MKYHVTITEINYGGVDVEAATEKEAQEKARQEYYKGNIFGKTANFQTLTPSLPHAANSIIENDMTVGILDKVTPRRRRYENGAEI